MLHITIWLSARKMVVKGVSETTFTILVLLLLLVMIVSPYTIIKLYVYAQMYGSSNITKVPSLKAMDDAYISQMKEALDKCTPFAKHINDVITLPDVGALLYTHTPRYEKISCKQKIEDLPDEACPSNLPDIAEKYSSICNDPRYRDWFVHYWKTRNATILQVLSNTSWTGSYGLSSGYSSVEGQGNKNITISCQGGDSYSATFSKKDNSQDTLKLNVIQNATGGQRILDPSTHNTPYYPIISLIR